MVGSDGERQRKVGALEIEPSYPFSSAVEVTAGSIERVDGVSSGVSITIKTLIPVPRVRVLLGYNFGYPYPYPG